MLSTRLDPARPLLARRDIDAWLVYDFRGGNPVLAQLLARQRWTTRRTALCVPRDGKPALLVHRIDAPQFDDLGDEVDRVVFLTWQDWETRLGELLNGRRRVAMEYSPRGELPAAAHVDAGTIELVRSMGAEVVSSADLVQACVARWSPEALAEHRRVSAVVNQVKDEAFDLARQRLRAGKRVTEYGVQQFILRRFAEEKLDPDHPPIVACNAHSADPHFEVSAQSPSDIRPGDWLLIDLWARAPGEQHIFSDITWVGFVGERVPDEHRRVFEAVKAARDAALGAARRAFAERRDIAGCEVDDAAMTVLRDAGFADGIVHRTGHSLSPGPKIHGLGVNIDHFETRDTRLLLPGLGFTIEPALYLPGAFGCRLEINVYLDETEGPVVTSGVQDEVIRI